MRSGTKLYSGSAFVNGDLGVLLCLLLCLLFTRLRTQFRPNKRFQASILRDFHTSRSPTHQCFCFTNSIANSDKQSSRDGLLFVRFWPDCQIFMSELCFSRQISKGLLIHGARNLKIFRCAAILQVRCTLFFYENGPKKRREAAKHFGSKKSDKQ